MSDPARTTDEALIKEFQCPGCLFGSDTDCGHCAVSRDFGMHCDHHRAGTLIAGIGNIYLGLPKGFNRPGPLPEGMRNNVYIWRDGDKPADDFLNVPVWALERDGFLFLRMFSPRIGVQYIHIIEGGHVADYPGVIDMATHLDDID